jgi:hypothetical protein
VVVVTAALGTGLPSGPFNAVTPFGDPFAATLESNQLRDRGCINHDHYEEKSRHRKILDYKVIRSS